MHPLYLFMRPAASAHSVERAVVGGESYDGSSGLTAPPGRRACSLRPSSTLSRVSRSSVGRLNSAGVGVGIIPCCCRRRNGNLVVVVGDLGPFGMVVALARAADHNEAG